MTVFRKNKIRKTKGGGNVQENSYNTNLLQAVNKNIVLRIWAEREQDGILVKVKGGDQLG